MTDINRYAFHKDCRMFKRVMSGRNILVQTRSTDWQ